MLTYSQLRRSRPGHRSSVREEDSVRHGWVPAGNRWIAVDVHEPTATERGGTVIIVGSALYVAVGPVLQRPFAIDADEKGLLLQLTKASKKEPKVIAVPADDPSVEEGLLANSVEERT